MKKNIKRKNKSLKDILHQIYKLACNLLVLILLKIYNDYKWSKLRAIKLGS